MNKRIRSFNNHIYSVECQKEVARLPIAKKLHDAFFSFDTNFKTIEGINEFLKEKTGFANNTMSAASLGLEEEYQFILDNIDTIDLDAYTNDFEDITTEARKIIREKNTTYWSNEDSKSLDEVEELLEHINSYSAKVRFALYRSPDNNYKFNESMFSSYEARLRS